MGKVESGAVSEITIGLMAAVLLVGLIGGWLFNSAVAGDADDIPVAAMQPAVPTVTVTATAAPEPAVPTVTVTAAPERRTVGNSPVEESRPPATPTAPTGTSPVTPSVHELRGTLQLIVNRNPHYPDNCRGFEEEGYGDLHVGQQVVVTDANGRTVAVGTLDRCRFSPLETKHQARGILFSFKVADVPDSSFYQIQVGTGQRGQVTFSKQDLQAENWRVALTL